VNDESHLINESLRGDSSAFGQLVRIHQDRLYNAVANFIGDRTEAEDVVQEAFVQAYLKLASFKRNAAFYTWLYRIAFNTAVSRKRRKRVETSVDQTRENTGGEPIDEGDTPGDRMLRDEQASLVHAALDLLSDEHRAILILREMDELDYDTIAGILEINIGTVRSRLHRARAQMRDKIAEIESH
jgi:RNA polymerase sigma-70 factor (ECF subfamily)